MYQPPKHQHQNQPQGKKEFEFFLFLKTFFLPRTIHQKGKSTQYNNAKLEKMNFSLLHNFVHFFNYQYSRKACEEHVIDDFNLNLVMKREANICLFAKIHFRRKKKGQSSLLSIFQKSFLGIVKFLDVLWLFCQQPAPQNPCILSCRPFTIIDKSKSSFYQFFARNPQIVSSSLNMKLKAQLILSFLEYNLIFHNCVSLRNTNKCWHLDLNECLLGVPTFKKISSDLVG